MLETLRRIVQEVNSAPDLTTALEVMVARVRASMGTEVCSIYLLDHQDNRYFLMATEGLKKEAIGTATLGFSEGLVGQVGMGEEPFHSFLGVPIIHHRKVLGVVVVQQRERRRFDTEEEAFLVTLSAQLAAVLAHAEATGSIDGIFGAKDELVTKFDGVVGCVGVAIGQAFVVYPPADFKSVPDRKVSNIKKELKTLNEALKRVRADIRALSEKARLTLPPEEQALFQVYERMLDDNALAGEIRNYVKSGNWVQGALRQVVTKHVAAFEAMEDPYLRARASDVRDLGLRILAYLQEAKTLSAPIPDRAIIVGDDITPTVFVDIPRERIVGIVSLHGSSNSHMSIVARSLGIPTVVGVGEFPLSRLEGLTLIVDGHRGEVIVQPSTEVVRQYQDIIDQQAELSKELDVVRDLPCETTDGHRIKLFVNTGLMADVNMSLQRGAEGVGL